MATTEQSWEQEHWEDLPDDLKLLFEDAEDDELMATIVTGFIALAHKTDRPITYCVGSLYMALLSEIQPEFLAAAIKAADKTLDGPGMEALLDAIND